MRCTGRWQWLDYHNFLSFKNNLSLVNFFDVTAFLYYSDKDCFYYILTLWGGKFLMCSHWRTAKKTYVSSSVSTGWIWPSLSCSLRTSIMKKDSSSRKFSFQIWFGERTCLFHGSSCRFIILFCLYWLDIFKKFKFRWRCVMFDVFLLFFM
jgi:hypothetical protein